MAEPRSMRSTLFTGVPGLASAPSPGVAPLRGRGTRSTPVLTELKIEGQNTDPSSVEGTAHFRSGDGYDLESGEESVSHYRQKLILEPEETGWKVTEVGRIEEGR